jgi:hypothetical chaperone protein
MYHDFCGIDFGTTNSAVSVLFAQKDSELIKFDNNSTIPTAIFFPEDGVYRPQFGKEAINNYINGSQGRFMRSLKRILGTDLMNLKTEVDGVYISYEDIISKFIKHLKDSAEKQIKKELTGVVLGRPVHFQDFSPDSDVKAESLLRKIAYNLGFKDIYFQYEPIAAAYSHERNVKREVLACVVDVGGGTSDFSIIRLGPNNHKKIDRKEDVLANTGIRIGGNDYDRDLSIKCFMPEFGYGTLLKPNPYNGRILPIPFTPYTTLSEWSSVNSLYTYKEKKNISQIYEQAEEKDKVQKLNEIVQKELGHTLLNKIEECKISLTYNNRVNIALDFLKNKSLLNIELDKFEEAIVNSTNKVVESLKECIKLAGVSADDINLIILTGGTTEIPYVKQSVLKLFPKASISEENKLSSVAQGLVYSMPLK